MKLNAMRVRNWTTTQFFCVHLVLEATFLNDYLQVNKVCDKKKNTSFKIGEEQNSMLSYIYSGVFSELSNFTSWFCAASLLFFATRLFSSCFFLRSSNNFNPLIYH